MQDASFLVVLVLVVIAVGVLAFIFNVRAKQARVREVETFAAQHGFRVEGDVNPFTSSINPDSTVIRNVVRGSTMAGEIIIYDHAPRLADGTEGRIASTMAAFRVARIPEFHLMLKGLLSLGASGINFPSHPEFSNRFTLLAEDETAIRRLFSSIVLDAFLALPEKRKWDVKAGQGWLLVSFGKAQGNEFRELLEESTRLAKAME